MIYLLSLASKHDHRAVNIYSRGEHAGDNGLHDPKHGCMRYEYRMWRLDDLRCWVAC
jgi:hypothetical protein